MNFLRQYSFSEGWLERRIFNEIHFQTENIFQFHLYANEIKKADIRGYFNENIDITLPLIISADI